MKWFEDRAAGGALALIAGAAGGLLLWRLGMSSVVAGPLLGAFCGAVLGVLLRKQITGVGAGLTWGMGLAFLFWLALPAGVVPVLAGTMPSMGMLDTARNHFPQLIGFILCFGVPIGVSLGLLSEVQDHRAETSFHWGRTFFAGGFAGIVSAWVLRSWMVLFGLIPPALPTSGLRSRFFGWMGYFLVAAVIGILFGGLFRRNLRGYGSGVGWGTAFGILWWFLGPLTLEPLRMGLPIDWSPRYASLKFGLLVGHVLFGALLGLLYSLLDRLWVWFLIETDPIHRDREGIGGITLRSLGWGAAASLAGGLLFSVVMVEVGFLPTVASLVGGSSPWLGFLVHLVISTLIGMSYGILFRREATNFGSGMAWGLVYGLIWWFLGPLTLLPVLLGGSPTWTTNAAHAFLPSLVGHLFYGIATAVLFFLLERYSERWLRLDPALSSRSMRPGKTLDSAVPALWLFILGTGVLLPILLG